ncbi:MAG: PEGA domain-containing protein [Deltaproteobacteria bacterium]|nr:MAG: PEGA domain-containing protein [Deltaproteobacteria bacterium]
MRDPRSPRRYARLASAGAVALVLASCAPRGRSVELVLHAPTEHHDAEVYVDGHYVGQLGAVVRPGARVRLAPGTHRVEIRKPGYFPVQRTVTVGRRGGPYVDLRVELPEDPR